MAIKGKSEAFDSGSKQRGVERLTSCSCFANNCPVHLSMYHVRRATVAGSSNHFTASSVLLERCGNRVTSHDAVFTFLFRFLIAETMLQAEQPLTQDLLSHLPLQDLFWLYLFL